jgi:hypothetical protein
MNLNLSFESSTFSHLALGLFRRRSGLGQDNLFLPEIPGLECHPSAVDSLAALQKRHLRNEYQTSRIPPNKCFLHLHPNQQFPPKNKYQSTHKLILTIPHSVRKINLPTMSNFYNSPPPQNPYSASSSSAAAQNLQFYPSTYTPNPVPGHGTPQQAYGYGISPAQNYGGAAGGYGFGAAGSAPGVSGRMGESGGLRTGWLAAFGTEGYEGEPPLLEELGVNFGHIRSKVCMACFIFCPLYCASSNKILTRFGINRHWQYLIPSPASTSI